LLTSESRRRRRACEVHLCQKRTSALYHQRDKLGSRKTKCSDLAIANNNDIPSGVVGASPFLARIKAAGATRTKISLLLTIRSPNRGRLGRQSPSNAEQQMFGKSDPMNSLSRDLSRARDRRDALASHVTTLTAQITELEVRLSAENDRRERERVVG